MNSLLHAIGLVRTPVLAAAEERVRKAEARLARLAEQLETAKGESRAWKAKAEDAERRAADLARELAHQTERLEKTRADLAHHVDARARLRQRITDTDRDLAVARDHLMAIEVKLDILEGAANVLDARTRGLAAPAPEGDGAA
ncbi:MAG: hypothetical protein AB7P99_19135 [Vicinamibacterales bacterium]